MILVTAALERELRPFQKIALPGVALLSTGIGRRATEKALAAFLAEHRPQIELLISSGFAGGLVRGLSPGELVLAERLRLEDGQEIEVEKELLAQAAAAFEPFGAHRGPVLTVGKLARAVEEKRRLGLRSRALAVEMEAFWIAALAREYRLPFLAVKAILDPLERPLPYFAGAVFGRRPPVGVALSLLSRPWQLLEVPRLAGAARLASSRLARALEALVGAFAVEMEGMRC